MENKEKEGEDREQMLVVGLGASAGGIEPLKSFFSSIGDNTGMAFIVVIHMGSEKESNLAEILQKHTDMQVAEVSEKTSIQKDHIYVIPPDRFLTVENGYLNLKQTEKKHGSPTIDMLFRTLAEKKTRYSAAIILSGAGSDGIAGMKRIKEEGGITFAQDPEEALHTSMPQNAINTGVIDKILPVKEMAKELLHYRDKLKRIVISEKADELIEEKETKKILGKIFKKIRSRYNHDFSNYRRSSILRRLDRRMRVNRIESLEEYLSILDKNPSEIDELYKDFLISVTNFFRDPDAFAELELKVIPKLFEDKDASSQIRVWVPGCATGEEAYSIAILLKEFSGTLENVPDIQIFASDVDKEALKKAREGAYPESIISDLSEERTGRFFSVKGDHFVVKKELRDLILFAPHNILSDPPFSNLDMITCRNLLIYLSRDLQTELFKLFHYSLNSKGILFLGKSDSTFGMENLFKTLSKKSQIYVQDPFLNTRKTLPKLPLLSESSLQTFGTHRKQKDQEINLEKMHWGILARKYAPESVLVTQNYEVIHSTDNINKFMEYSGGKPSHNILEMVKPEIRKPLRSLLYKLDRDESSSTRKIIEYESAGEKINLELSVYLFVSKHFSDGLIHILFKELQKSPETASHSADADIEPDQEEKKVIEELENELEYTKERLQLTIEEYETSNEELKAANEELQSMNEELQSTTEELETSKEELQSVNEELKTVNEELEMKIKELDQSRSDLENLMEATEVGILFVNRDLRIQRYTESARKIFNLIETDEGRPIEHITHSLNYDRLIEDIKHSIENQEDKKRAVSTTNSRWFIMRIRPYVNSAGINEGIVLTFTEFTELKEAEETIREQKFQETLALLGIYAAEFTDPDKIVNRAIQQVCYSLDLSCAAYFELNQSENRFVLTAEECCDFGGDTVENDKKWDIGYSAHLQELLTVTDYKEEDRFSHSPLADKKSYRSSVLIPLKYQDSILGVIVLYSEEKRSFNKTEISFLKNIATLISMKFGEHQILNELREINSRLEEEKDRSVQLQKEVLSQNISEKWQLGSFLHDDLGQLLATAKIITDDINKSIGDDDEELQSDSTQLLDIINKAIEDIRIRTQEILPVDIESEGVTQAFRLSMNRFKRLYQVNFEFEHDGVLDEIKSPETASHTYHILQESIINSVTHGKAKNITIQVQREDNHLLLRVKDDGSGISDKVADIRGKGIQIMKYRVNLMDGHFSITNSNDPESTGTIVECKIPLASIG